MGDEVPVWRVDRTFSDDEQNLIIVTYATPDGRRSHRKERAVQRLGPGTDISIPDRVRVSREDLSPVEDPETVEWYRSAVEDVRARADSA